MIMKWVEVGKVETGSFPVFSNKNDHKYGFFVRFGPGFQGEDPGFEWWAT
jgi:hypothetical protein